MTERRNILIRDLRDVDDEVMEDFINYFKGLYDKIISYEIFKYRKYIDKYTFENEEDNRDKINSYVCTTKKYNIFFTKPSVYINMLKRLNKPFIVLNCGEDLLSQRTVIDIRFILGMPDVFVQKDKFE